MVRLPILVANMLTLCLILTSCATSTVLKQREALIGQPVVTVLQCAGAPDSEYKEGNLRLLTYSSREAAAFQGIGVYHECKATVTVQDGRITDIRFVSTRQYVDKLANCEPIFRGCL